MKYIFFLSVVALCILAAIFVSDETPQPVLVDQKISIPPQPVVKLNPQLPAQLDVEIIDLQTGRPCDPSRPINTYVQAAIATYAGAPCGEVHIRRRLSLTFNRRADFSVQEQHGAWHLFRFIHRGWNQNGTLNLDVANGDAPPYGPFFRQQIPDKAQWLITMPDHDVVVYLRLRARTSG